MALPIAATPVLEGEAAKIFFAKIESNLKRPSRLIDTPNLGKAKELIREYAAKRRQE